MSKPVLGRSLGKLLSGDRIAGKFEIPPSGGPGVPGPSKPGTPITGSGMRQLMRQPVSLPPKRQILPRWYLLLVDGLLLLAAEGIVLKYDSFAWPQWLLCAGLVITGLLLTVIGILETKD